MKENYKVLFIATFTNIVLGLVKLFAGIFMYSSALISEAVDSFMDVLNNLVAIFAVNRSHKPADKEHPFGHGKYEYVGSMILGIIIVIVGFNLILGFANIETEVPLVANLYVIVGATIIKLVLAMYLKRKGTSMNNHLVYALGVENQTDIYKSIVVFVGVSLSVFLDFKIFGLTFDNIAAIIIGIYIIKTGIGIMIESRDNILGKSSDDKTYKEIMEIIQKNESILGINDLKVIKYGPYIQVLVSIIVDGDITVSRGHDIASSIKRDIHQRSDVSYVLVHVDPDDEL